MMKGLILGVLAGCTIGAPNNSDVLAERYKNEMEISITEFSNLEESEDEIHGYWWLNYKRKQFNTDKNWNHTKVSKELMDNIPDECKDRAPGIYTNNVIDFYWINENLVIYSVYELE